MTNETPTPPKIQIIATCSSGTNYQLICKNMLASWDRLNTGYNIQVNHIPAESSTGFNTPQYWINNMTKLNILAETLQQCGENDIVVQSDVDIVFLCNPLPMLQNILEQYDMAIQKEYGHYAYCGGFFAIKKRALPIVTPTDNMEQYCNVERMGDQGYINEQIEQHPEIKIYQLPETDYPNGMMWFQSHQTLNPYLVHYNCLTTTEEKIEKMKQYNHWLI